MTQRPSVPPLPRISDASMPPPRTTITKPAFKISKIALNAKPAGSTINLGARWGHSSCLVDNKRLFIIGGIGNNLVHDTCLFDFGSSAWIEAHAAGKSPGSRYGHSTVLLSVPYVEKSCILLFGGRNITKKYFNDLYLLDTSTLSWMCLPADKSFPDPRAGHTAILITHPLLPFPRLVIFGGNHHNKYLNSIYVMDVLPPINFQWSKPNVKGTPPCPRSGHTCTHIPNSTKMLVFGGFDGKKCFNDVHVFCAATYTWSQVTPYGTPPRPRSGHTASLVGDRFWVIFGGCSDAVFLNDFHILDLKGGAGSDEQILNWLPQPSLPLTIAPRFHHSCDTIDNSIVIFGGCASGALFNDMISMDVSPLFDLPDYPLPQHRSAHHITTPSASIPESPHSAPLVTSAEYQTPTTAPAVFALPATPAIALSRHPNTTEATSPRATSTPTSSIPPPASPIATADTEPMSTPNIDTTPPKKLTASTEPAEPTDLAGPTTKRTEQLEFMEPTKPTTKSTQPTTDPTIDPIVESITEPTNMPTATTTSVVLPTLQDSPSSTLAPTSPLVPTLNPSTPRDPNQASASSPPSSAPAPPLSILHASTSFTVPDIVHLKQDATFPASLQGNALLQRETGPTPLELCLTSALASLASEQQKVKEMELLLARERASHATLRADFVAEQIKVKELEERRVKTEKEWKKSQKNAHDSKNYNQTELQKAHSQISSLRAELSKFTEKDTDRRPHSSHQNHKHHNQHAQQDNSCSKTNQPQLLQRFHTLFDSCTPDNLDVLDLPALIQLNTAHTKAGSHITAAKDKKMIQLMANMEGLRLELATSVQRVKEGDEALAEMSGKYETLQRAHAQEKDTLRHLHGEGLDTMDATALEKLEEIHHKGLRTVGAAKTQALAQQVARLQREKEELAERVVCVVCADGVINTILAPCGHRCMCKPCADLLSACPLCRKPIHSKLQYFP